MKDNYSIFEFRGYFKSYPNEIQYRYVCAEDEDQAKLLMDQYSADLVSKGFDEYIWQDNPTVRLSSVISG